MDYKQSKGDIFKSSNVKEWYSLVNSLINNGQKRAINLTNVPELAYKPTEEAIETINQHFAKICNKYPPIGDNYKKLINPDEKKFEMISELETYKLIKKFSKKALGPGDFPRRILKEFAVELAAPFCDITNCSVKKEILLDIYKKAIIVPIPKENPPRSMSDLRPISKTPIGGKIIEKRMNYESEIDLKHKADPDQYGNEKGCSTSHYLIKLMDEAFRATDKGLATTAITIDYSKAFDYVSHPVLIDKLKKLGFRSSLVNMFVSFLSNRSHCTQILNTYSSYAEITCGVPQGTCSGPKLFSILIIGEKCSLVKNYKYVDDKTITYTHSGDPSELLQKALDMEVEETEKDKMIINSKKCNSITFNFSKNNSAPKDLQLNNNALKQCDKIKLLGVILSKDLKWHENTRHICSKVNKKYYILSKLKQFGFGIEELIKAWETIIRPVAEYAAPLWHSGLTNSDRRRIEFLQKKALGIILGISFVECKKFYKIDKELVPYEEALEKLGLISLESRREILTSNFAVETFKNERHRDMFPKIESSIRVGRTIYKVKEENCRSARFFNSAIPYMKRILNGVITTRD